MNLIADIPINNLSFGNVGVNILRELYNKKINVGLFPRGDQKDLSAFDKLPEEFKVWLDQSIQSSMQLIDKDTPTLTLWHLRGAERRITSKQFLLTFYELETPTFVEKKVAQMQDHVFLTSPSSVKCFQSLGCDNVSQVNIGFDPDLQTHTGEKMVQNKVHFVLMGKFEKRKHTKEIIQAWAKKYGNNNDYMLSCCVNNPFLKQEQMSALLSQVLDGKTYSNINLLPHLKTNTEVNHLLNSADIDLTGLSGAEGWNLPAFNATALGKWSIVYNHTGHQSWATKDNSILLEPPINTDEIYDNMFFHKGQNYNQGFKYSFNEDQVIQAMETAADKCKSTNTEGLKLQEDFSYSKTVDQILSKLN